jgi:predicted pyridoxine 5'-phosphate oxidase superfamily flavin-nucleotide-binding protein
MGSPLHYHAGSRQLQDAFDSRRLADRIADRLARARFTDEDRAFVEGAAMFFLATADAAGAPDCSYKGGAPGFVRLLDESTLAFPSYDGNGMFKSLGNVLVNPQVGLLFIDFESPRRLRVQGRATLHDDERLLGSFSGAQRVVVVQSTAIFPNCPRYIHPMPRTALSEHAPRPDHEPPDAAWKRFELFRDVLPRR